MDTPFIIKLLFEEKTMSNLSSVEIPTRSLWSVMALAVTVYIGWLVAGYLGPSFSNAIKTVIVPPMIYMGLISTLVTYYLLAGTTIVLTINIFLPLKSVAEKGLVWSLVWGLAWGLGWALVWNSFAGTVVWTLFFGLGLGFVVSLVFGLFVEFEGKHGA